MAMGGALTRHLQDLPSLRQFVLLVGLAGAIAAGLWLFFWTQRPGYVPLFAEIAPRAAAALPAAALEGTLEPAAALASPDGAAPEKIERHILEHVPGVAAVGHIHVWSITSGRTLATMHVRPANDTEARVVVGAVERELASDFEVEHAAVAVDWNEEGETCSLAPGSKRDEGRGPGHDHPSHSHGGVKHACSH